MFHFCLSRRSYRKRGCDRGNSPTQHCVSCPSISVRNCQMCCSAALSTPTRQACSRSGCKLLLSQRPKPQQHLSTAQLMFSSFHRRIRVNDSRSRVAIFCRVDFIFTCTVATSRCTRRGLSPQTRKSALQCGDDNGWNSLLNALYTRRLSWRFHAAVGLDQRSGSEARAARRNDTSRRRQ